MKSFVIMTYYQLMHAVAYTLELKEKANLYFSESYLGIGEDFLDKIRKTGVFNKVIGLSQDEYVVPYVEELKKANKLSSEEIDKIGNSIFEKYLEPHYEKLFVDADFEDEIFVYNDFQRHYYYIAKHFKKIIGIEDGYKSLEQQTKIHKFKGHYKLVEPFLGKYYPEPLYRFEKIEKIISSSYFEDIDDYYKKRLEVLDFNELVEKNQEVFVQVMLQIFDLQELEIEPNSTLILGTPLSRAKYCNSVQNYLFFRKLISTELNNLGDNEKIYIKPHPADTLDYHLITDDRVVVLPGDFPIEILEYKDVRFAKTISVGSTAVVDKLSENNELLYQGDGSIKDIKRFIKFFIQEEQLTLNIYIKVTGLTSEEFINIYSYLKKFRDLKINIKLLVPEDRFVEYQNYYSSTNLCIQIKDYYENNKNSLYKNFHKKEIDKLGDSCLQNKYESKVEFLALKSFDDVDIYNDLIKFDTCDYFLLLDSKNMGAYVLQKIVSALRKEIAYGYIFLNYTYVSELSEKRIFLESGETEGFYTNSLWNRLLNRKLFDDFSGETLFRSDLGKILHNKSEKIIVRAILFLHLGVEQYIQITDGELHYNKLLQEVIELSKKSRWSKEEELGYMSVVLSEFVNWNKICRPKQQNGSLTKFVDKLQIPIEEKFKIITVYCEALMSKNRIEQNRMIYNDIMIYDYYIHEINALINDETMEKKKQQKERKGFTKFRSRVLKKLKRIIKLYD